MLPRPAGGMLRVDVVRCAIGMRVTAAAAAGCISGSAVLRLWLLGPHANRRVFLAARLLLLLLLLLALVAVAVWVRLPMCRLERLFVLGTRPLGRRSRLCAAAAPAAAAAVAVVPWVHTLSARIANSQHGPPPATGLCS
eukprot:355230-Chlamydomonas_euryale.AAC.1